MGSHLGICLLREQAVLPPTNDISRQPSPWGQGQPLRGLRQQLMAEDRLPGSTAETQIEAASLQDRDKKEKKKWPNYKALRQDMLHNSLSPPQLQKASQPLSTINPTFSFLLSTITVLRLSICHVRPLGHAQCPTPYILSHLIREELLVCP